MTARTVAVGCLLTSTLVLGGCSDSAAPPQTEPLRLGVHLPLTGDLAFEGLGMERSLRMVVDAMNAAGGFDGRMVELFVEDDRGTEAQAAVVAERLVSAGVQAVIRGYNSTATQVSSTIFHREGILHVTPSSSVAQLTKRGYGRFFRACFPNDRFAQFAAEFIDERLAVERVALVHDNSVYAHSLAEWTEEALAARGFSVAHVATIDPTSTNYAAILDGIAAAGIEAVFFTGYSPQAGLLLKLASERELDVLWLLGNASNNQEVIAIAGVEHARGAIMLTDPQPSDLTHAEALQFRAAYIARYGEEATSIWWLMAADAFNVIGRAVLATGSTDSATLASWLHSNFMPFTGVTGQILGFDANGDRVGANYTAYTVSETGAIVPYQ